MIKKYIGQTKGRLSTELSAKIKHTVYYSQKSKNSYQIVLAYSPLLFRNNALAHETNVYFLVLNALFYSINHNLKFKNT